VDELTNCCLCNAPTWASSDEMLPQCAECAKPGQTRRDDLLAISVTLALIAVVGVLCWFISFWLYFVIAGLWVAYEIGRGSDEEQFNRRLRREFERFDRKHSNG